MTKETDPTGKTAHEVGAKLDGGKVMAGLLSDFSLALLEVAKVCTHGAKKYSRGGWQHVSDGIERYKDAQYRHMLDSRHEEFDKDSGLLHLAHETWNCLAQLELKLRIKKHVGSCKIYTKSEAKELFKNNPILYAELAHQYPCCDLPQDLMCSFCGDEDFDCPRIKNE